MPAYVVKILCTVDQLPTTIENKINDLVYAKNLKLVSTYTNNVLGDTLLYGIFELL